jgi:Zn-dependent protease with chaperone function
MNITADYVPPIRVERWPTEIPLQAVAVLASLVLWLLATISIVGLIYALLLGVFFFVAHLAFVAHVRGSGVRIGPDQFPELHESIERIARSIGLARAPEAYVLQAGGALNALATRFIGANMLVLFSDLLDACEGDPAARDMIIGHELGHLRAGHLRFLWLILPAWLVPFLGSGLSRAREYTADRYGFAVVDDPAAARVGLMILAAGGPHGRRVKHEPFLRQREVLNTGWMTLGEWFASHPPLAKRLAAVEPAAPGIPLPLRGAWRAIGILVLVMTPFVVGGVLAVRVFPAFMKSLAPPAVSDASATTPAADAFKPATEEAGRPVVIADLGRLAAVIEERRTAGFEIPWDADELYLLWSDRHPGQPDPVDPFDGETYGYSMRGSDYILWSVGPDGDAYTADDLLFDSRIRGIRSRRDPVPVTPRPATPGAGE